MEGAGRTQMRQNGVTALPRVAGPLLILGVVLAGTGLFCSQFEPLATTGPAVNAVTAEARWTALSQDSQAATATARAGWPSSSRTPSTSRRTIGRQGRPMIASR